MINQVVLVGRLCSDPQIKELENDVKLCYVTIACQRAYKNENGEYDTDFLDCTLWTNVAENTVEYCQTGDMVGVKGRIQSRVIQDEDGNKNKRTEIVAEKVTFLSSAQRKNMGLSTEDTEEEFSGEE